MTAYVNLKKLKSRITEAAMLMFLLTLYACGEKDEPTQEGTTKQEVLDIPASELSKIISYNGGTASVNFVSTLAWRAAVSAEASSWLHVSPAEGDGGDNCTIVLTADKNQEEDPRTGTVTIRSGELSRTITVTQEGATLDITASDIPEQISYKGGTASVSFVASLAWTAEVATEASSWLHVSPAEGNGGENCTILLTIDKNEIEEPRTGTVTIRSGEISRTITVTQEAGMLVPGSEGPDDMPIEPW